VNGASPHGPLTLGNDGNFYGTTANSGGGVNGGDGTVFRVTTNGTLTRLVLFTGPNGNGPSGGLTLGSDGRFYGTTAAGGLGGNGTGVGTVFRVTTSGAFSLLASFGNGDGINPRAPLTQGSDGNFYGSTEDGGFYGYGMIFRVTTNGALTDLASFNHANGAYPHTALTLGKDGNFYGTTADGGASPAGYTGVGTVYRVTPNGALTLLYSFYSDNNPNGTYPQAALTLGNDGNFYGTASAGGSSGVGTVFRITPNGAFTRLVSFNNANGAKPEGPLTLGSDGNFYGTTPQGGIGGAGTVFKVTTNGILTTLVSFNASGGQHPQHGLTLGNDGYFYGLVGTGVPNGPGTFSTVGTLFKMTSEGTLTTLGSFSYVDQGNFRLPPLTLGADGDFYGTTPGGSSVNSGTIFQLTKNGTFTTLVSFSNTDGAVPLAPLTVGSDGNLYGTTAAGGTPSEGWSGTIFRISLGAPVVISQPQPATQFVVAGENFTVEASVFGAPPLNFQWSLNEANLDNETNLLLTLSSATPSMSGNYALRVTNALGHALSTNAVVTVLPALVTNLPLSGMTATGVVLNGSVTVGPNTTLAWFEWGTDTSYGQIAGITNIPGGSGMVSIRAALSGLDYRRVYYYRIVVWNNFGIEYGPDQSFRAGAVPDHGTPIAISGYNRDVILERTATTPYNNWAQAFDNGYSCFFEEGYPLAPADVTGLPQGGAFTSAVDGKTVFQIGPYDGSNVLYMTGQAPYGRTATLSLNGTPQAYDSLSILAASADASTGKSAFVINFSDGTSSGPQQYYAPDWSYPTGVSNSAITVARAVLSLGGSIQNLPFALYQTDINLSALDLNTKPIASLTFSSTNALEAGIFALSGIIAIPPPLLQVTSVAALTNGTIRLTISNPGNELLSVLGTTDASLSVTNWVPLGAPHQIGPGLFEFIDVESSSYPARFYRVRGQ
jgi:uncharacterized repeat protein (TIGR03803 family)